MSKGLAILLAEHRRFAAILSCMSSIVHERGDALSDADIETLAALADYAAGFVYTFHHPKEDRYLFPAVRRRAPKVAAVLDELEAQHSRGAQLIAAAGDAVAAWRRGEGEREAIAEAVERYTTFERKHMRDEDTRIIPVARSALEPEDWEEIDAAFAEHEDPIFGDDRSEKFDRLFSEIIARTPAPHGLAAEGSEEPDHRNPWSALKQMIGI